MVLPCFKLISEPDDEKAKSIKPFRWASPDVGKRNKIGGFPYGIKEEEYPKCPFCGKKMTFYGQLDSINDDYIIADCGLIAVFICFDCNEVSAEIVSG
ncbi:MAG: hypothetical protein J5631_06320 [Spirochaetaceae bacterium]|nr:hypothetical protein [Spirochaetaceae bacterium]